MQIIIVSGLSGSGKSVALHTFEDLGYYCIDNLPLDVLPALFQSSSIIGRKRIAIGADVRMTGERLVDMSKWLDDLKAQGYEIILLYLHANKEVLRKRYNETRRKHPLSGNKVTLDEALDNERKMMSDTHARADLDIDTTRLDIYQLANVLKNRVANTKKSARLSVLFQSFGFKYGAPADTDFMFDVRCLPNPYWDENLRLYTGLDKPIEAWLSQHDDVNEMVDDLTRLIDRWIPRFIQSQRAYLTFSMGCTGGKHRSVYITEQLFHYFKDNTELDVMTFHREL